MQQSLHLTVNQHFNSKIFRQTGKIINCIINNKFSLFIRNRFKMICNYNYYLANNDLLNNLPGISVANLNATSC